MLRRLIGPLELIHAQAGPRLLRLTRLGVMGLWIVKLLLDPLWRLADYPRDLFDPISLIALLPASFIDQLLTPGGLTTFWFLTLVTLALCLTDRAFHVTSTIAALLVTAYSCLIRCFGPAVHTDIALILAVYALTGFAWADFFEIKFGKAKSSPGTWSSFPLVTIIMFLCMSYMLVGFNRIIESAPRIFTGDTMETYAVDASLRGYYFNTNIGWHVPESAHAIFMLKLGFPIITVFEILAPLCLVSSRFRWIFMPTMLSFHLLSLVFMNIFFFDDMLLYLLLIDWSKRYPAVRSPGSRTG